MPTIRSNNLSKLNAMKYLADKQPDIFLLRITPFTVYSQKYAVELFEIVVDSQDNEFLTLVDKIEFKPRFEEWS